MTRGLLKESLEAAGFRVIAVESARHAIKEFDRADPDALVVDIDLGDRPNGVDLAVMLRAQAPYLGVVFLTNYPSIDKVEGGFQPPPGSSFLNKGSLENSAGLVAAIEASLSDEAESVTVRSAERLVSRTFTALGIDDDSRLNPRVAAARMYVRVFGVPEAPRTRA